MNGSAIRRARSRPEISEVCVEGRFDRDGRIRYLGSAYKQPDGTWVALAVIDEHYLCRVECAVRFGEGSNNS